MVSSKKSFIAGIGFVLIFALIAFALAELSWVKALQLSPLIVGIVLGMVFANTLRHKVPQAWNGGIAYSAKSLLRIGVALFGFRISLADVASVGLSAMVMDAIIVSVTLLLGVGLGRLLKMDRETALLTSIGSSICGAAAVLAAEPIVKAPAYKTAVAVSTVVLFGTLAMFLYPACYHAGLFHLSAQQLSIFTGGTLHEVAHAVGAGEAMNVMRDAVIVKMIRVIMLAPVLLVVSFILCRGGREGGQGKSTKVGVPFFAVMFIVVICFNSLDLLPSALVSALNSSSTFLLTMAMTALGLNTSFAQMKQAGWRPFALAFMLFIWLFFGGYALTQLVTSIF